jgi:glycerate 2-kinase
MRFIDQDQLISNGSNEVYKQLRRDALKILEATLVSADPEIAILNKIKRNGNLIKVDQRVYDLENYSRVFIIGGGKAGGRMAVAIERVFADSITDGFLNIPRSQNHYSLKYVKLNFCSHPIPDADGIKGVNAMLNMVKGCSEKDLVICLISGGGSALMPLPVEGLSLQDLQYITSLLLKQGATINELNIVRKHLDGFKGGQLAKACGKADILTLILSDVVGDPIDIIASGPTVPDPSTFNDAVTIMKKTRVWDLAPENIKNRLTKGIRGEIPETPKTTDPIFGRVQNVVIANNMIALEAAECEAKKNGYNTLILSSLIEGEAKIVGEVYAAIAGEIILSGKPIRSPAAVIAGGETTVEVHGLGSGGRNQELVLGAIKKIKDLYCVVASMGTDGVDGTTGSAGGLVDGVTLLRSLKAGLNLEESLRENDSYNYLNKLGDTLKTGPTGTNVNDIHLILVSSDPNDKK